MASLRSDFYFKWVKDRIQATFDAAETLNGIIEYVGVDTTLNPVPITFPDTTDVDLFPTKTLWIIDVGENAGTNNITLLPNPLDTSTLNGQPSYTMRFNKGVTEWRLIDEVWTLTGRSPYPDKLQNVLVTDATFTITTQQIVVANPGLVSGSPADIDLTMPLSADRYDLTHNISNPVTIRNDYTSNTFRVNILRAGSDLLNHVTALQLKRGEFMTLNPDGILDWGQIT